MSETPSIPSHSSSPKAAAAHHAEATCGWQAVLASVVSNILATYSLQNAQDQMIEQIANTLKDVTTIMTSTLDGLSASLQNDVKNNADGSKITADQNAYQNAQLKYQNQMTPITRYQDQWTQAVQDTGNSTSPAYQEAQALASIAQNMAQRA